MSCLSIDFYLSVLQFLVLPIFLRFVFFLCVVVFASLFVFSKCLFLLFCHPLSLNIYLISCKILTVLLLPTPFFFSFADTFGSVCFAIQNVKPLLICLYFNFGMRTEYEQVCMGRLGLEVRYRLLLYVDFPLLNASFMLQVFGFYNHLFTISALLNLLLFGSTCILYSEFLCDFRQVTQLFILIRLQKLVIYIKCYGYYKQLFLLIL